MDCDKGAVVVIWGKRGLESESWIVPPTLARSGGIATGLSSDASDLSGIFYEIIIRRHQVSLQMKNISIFFIEIF